MQGERLELLGGVSPRGASLRCVGRLTRRHCAESRCSALAWANSLCAWFEFRIDVVGSLDVALVLAAQLRPLTLSSVVAQRFVDESIARNGDQ